MPYFPDRTILAEVFARLSAHARHLVLPCLAMTGIGYANAADIPYVVRSSDNPWTISKRYLSSMEYWPRLVKYNRIANAWRIPPGTTLRIPEDWLARHAAPARVIGAEGRIALRLPGGANRFLSAGEPIPVGGIITTGPSDNFSMVLVDGSRILVKADSEFKLESNARQAHGGARDILLDLWRGAFESDVEKQSGSGGRFQIRTPAAMAAVRGTTFRVKADSEALHSEVVEGKVDLSNQTGAQSLSGGHASTVRTNRTPEPARPMLIAPDLSAIPNQLGIGPTHLDIPTVPNARAYRTQIARDARFTTLIQDQVSDAPRLLIPALTEGHYHLRARAIDALGLEGFDAHHELTIERPRGAPDPEWPPGGARLDESAPRFGWRPQEGAQAYRIQIAHDHDFTDLVLDRRDLDANAFKGSTALDAGEYYWRVAALHSGYGQGPFSEPRSLRVLPPLPQVELRQDQDRATLRWRPRGLGERCQVQFDPRDDFAQPSLDLILTQFDTTLPETLSGSLYMRARAIAGDGFLGAWGATTRHELPSNTDPTRMFLLLPLLLGF